MTKPKEVLFGPVIDEQKDYWQRSKLAQRDAALLDQHFDARSHGQKFQMNGMSAYAIPKSQKVALRESRVGGIPIPEGGMQDWNEAYIRAQAKFAAQGGNVSVPDPWGGRTPGSMTEEVDIGRILQNRMASQAAAPPLPNHGPMPGHAMATGQQQSQQTPPVCTLQEGLTFYQPLKIDGFGTTQPLAKSGGTIRGVQGRQFQVGEQVTVYVIDGLQTVDLSKMEPGRMRSLIRVSAPLLGTFLVPQEAIQEVSGGAGSGKQLLIDSSQQYRTEQQMRQQQQYLHQQQQQQRPGLLAQVAQKPVMSQQPRPTNPQEILQQQSRDMLRRRGLLKG